MVLKWVTRIGCKIGILLQQQGFVGCVTLRVGAGAEAEGRDGDWLGLELDSKVLVFFMFRWF